MCNSSVYFLSWVVGCKKLKIGSLVAHSLGGKYLSFPIFLAFCGSERGDCSLFLRSVLGWSFSGVSLVALFITFHCKFWMEIILVKGRERVLWELAFRSSYSTLKMTTPIQLKGTKICRLKARALRRKSVWGKENLRPLYNVVSKNSYRARREI